jgi:hypothetical protein
MYGTLHRSHATHKHNGLSDFRISDLWKLRFDLHQYRVEALELYCSGLGRLLGLSPYSGTPQFQHFYYESVIGIAELDQGVLPREPLSEITIRSFGNRV